MTEQFQLSLLSYLVQSSSGESYIGTINDDTFDIVEFKLASQLLKQYYNLHHRIPGELEASDYLEKTITRTGGMTDSVAKALREVFEDIYVPIDKRNLQFIEDTLIIDIQTSQLDILSSRFAKGEITSKEFIDKIAPISALALPGQDEMFNESGFLVLDRGKHSDEQIHGIPTYLNDLNKLTAAGGFYSPQLIVIMSGPKHFKTGIALSLALNFVRDGYKVYYADIENGARAIRNRLKMCAMECELRDLFDPSWRDDIDTTLELTGRYMGGDIFVDNYPANHSSVKDVENRLAFLKETYGFVPDMIFWDPLDKFIPSKKDDLRRDTRIQSQIVYHEAINLNKKLGCFGFTPSQVHRAAISKKVFTMGDIAEDFGRVMIAHAVFAICATDDELENGIRRIIPVAQREGVGYKGKNQCIVHVDEARMIVKEAEQINENVNDD